MPQVTVTYNDQTCEVTTVDHFPLSVYISSCQRQLGLPRRWQDDLYAGMGWSDVVQGDISVTLHAFYEVKVHFSGRKAKVRCTVGNTLEQIAEAAARELKLPNDWISMLTIEHGHTWQTVFSSNTQVYLKDPRQRH